MAPSGGKNSPSDRRVARAFCPFAKLWSRSLSSRWALASWAPLLAFPTLEWGVGGAKFPPGLLRNSWLPLVYLSILLRSILPQNHSSLHSPTWYYASPSHVCAISNPFLSISSLPEGTLFHPVPQTSSTWMSTLCLPHSCTPHLCWENTGSLTRSTPHRVLPCPPSKPPLWPLSFLLLST